MAEFWRTNVLPAALITLLIVFGAPLALSNPIATMEMGHGERYSETTQKNFEPEAYRQPKTMDMAMSKGMGFMKDMRDMLQNGYFRPVPPPFPALQNLFKVNGTHLTWVPLGSIIFGNNGKIIGG